MSKTSFEKSLDLACIMYTRTRLAFLLARINEGDLVEVDTRRTQAHNSLLASFHALLRSRAEVPPDMRAIAGSREAVGKWAIERAVQLVLNGSSSIGHF